MEDDAGPGGGTGPDGSPPSGLFERFLKGLRNAQALLISIGAVILAAGGVWSAITQLGERSETPVTTGTTSTTKTASLTIEQPKDGGTIRVLDDVHVRVKGAGVDRLIWILVKFKNGDVIYPQGECNDVSDELTVCPAAQFGDKGTRVGAQFEITAVLVDAQGHQRYKSYHASGFPLAKPPVTPLAESQTVTVRRV